ncbi:hypothetical protein QE152_g729 [Popillia japonica]|uniref:Uncharacterized protein n=1 Tax=Popillia japonica TaxID=7064 RepID=A0AAW1NIW7_POPJA
MESSSTETQSLAEIISTSINCDNLDNSELFDPEFELLSAKEKQEEAKNFFEAAMDDLESTDFMRTDTPLSEDLEIEKIMEQLESTIQDDIFANNRSINISNKINSMKENEENLDELNLLNNDIISYINSDDKDTNSRYSNEEDSDRSCDRSNQERNIIDLINKELEETLQFTDVLCHYVYNDVIIGKDFFKLFSSESVGKNDAQTVKNVTAVE